MPEPIIAHPGVALRNAIALRGWTVMRCAMVLNSDPTTLYRVVRGERPLGVRLALQLEAAGLGAARDWVGRQRDFELARERPLMAADLADISREALMSWTAGRPG